VVIWYILWSFGIYCGHLVYFVVIWYILWSFGIFCGHLAHIFQFYLTKKTVAKFKFFEFAFEIGTRPK
jgi:hypothetical protein